ncbi:GNAT family N-acetyltransferase [Bacillus sp. SD088]|uniref:GNAT family N-acetyltransferase n=1 Tax=Bacillus sp. SD088 TaxID=2782012 RepID=UPI001A95E01D|nr:GNAT family N-acetyltransferase [Bacillus sp. SD088]MBO0992985.1 GNAT family N-acetyltransferase [Bacillus sp. SD088]
MCVKTYISLPGRRDGYIVAYNNEGLPIGNAIFRISSDGQTMYLIGAAVLPEYRNKGVYHSLLQYRINKSKEEGCQLLTVQARARTS